MAKKQTETALVSSELQASLNILTQFKDQIDKIGENCLQIKVVDESTLSVAMNNLSKANDMVKFIEEKRVEVKEPHLNNCKVIDSTCKELAKSVVDAVEHLKKEIKAYELLRLEAAEKAKKELERKQEEEAKALEADNKRKADIQTYLNGLVDYCKKQYAGLKTIEDCDKFTATLNSKWPAKEKLQEFYEQGLATQKSYLDFASFKRQQFTDADNMSQEQKDLIIEKENLIKEREALALKEAALKEKEDAIAAEKAKKELEEKNRLEAEKLAAEEASKKQANTRKTWKIELVDKTKLIPEWISLNESVVKEYMKENKDSIKHGDIINGVKFYQEISISA